MSVRPKIMKLARMIGGLPGMLNKLDENSPEYYCLDCVVTDEMADAYLQLHKMGHAKSVEVWQNDELVGGLYGIDLGNMFCGESMFSLVPNASKVAFHYLVELTKQWNYHIIDGQIYNAYLAQLGFIEIEREEFAQFLPIID